MARKHRILLKITGELFQNDTGLSTSAAQALVAQIKQLQATHHFGIVIGGGNLFRGGSDAQAIQIRTSTGHQVGMFATMINSLLLYDLLYQAGIPAVILSAAACPTLGQPISAQAIDHACTNNQLIIFAGGTGAPYVTTDTSAVIRALQFDADALWKGSHVDSIYTADPEVDADAQRLSTVTHKQALSQQLGVIDPTALQLAQQHNTTVRVFDITSTDALLQAAHNNSFGSTIETKTGIV